MRVIVATLILMSVIALAPRKLAGNAPGAGPASKCLENETRRKSLEVMRVKSLAAKPCGPKADSEGCFLAVGAALCVD
jgi:hypothetical protein